MRIQLVQLVADVLEGYKHAMRDRRGGRGQKRSAARSAQQPLGDGATWDVASGSVTGSCEGERDNAWSRINQSRERWVTERAKHQPRGIGKPVAMEW